MCARKSIFNLILTISIMFGFNSNGQGTQGVPAGQKVDRKPAAAGRFYPADKAELENELAELFHEAKPGVTTHMVAVIVPHAGYVFSGEVAASGISQVPAGKEFDNVFIIGSSHQVSFNGASVYNRGDYVTPLGTVPVNTEIAGKLISAGGVFSFNPDADKSEHSVEVEVPFLQYHLKKPFRIVPIVIGTQSPQTCKKIAEALRPWFNERNLFVISTDFSHYPSYSDAEAADKATCDAIVGKDPAGLVKFLDTYRDKEVANLATNLCGWTSVLTLLYLASGPSYKFTPIRYMNSGDSKYGDKGQVVGYWSIAVTTVPSDKKEQTGFVLDEKDKKDLLRIARATLYSYITSSKRPALDTSAFSDNLKAKTGVFVTLKEKGQLRGCIGRFSADEPLWKTVVEMTISSATQDTRFSPVSTKELEDIDIDISVLTPMKKITSIDEIKPGRDGIYIVKGYSSGTFLPQVATETGWNVEELLGHCAMEKAGIGWDGWKTADIYTYQAVVFSESELSGSKY